MIPGAVICAEMADKLDHQTGPCTRMTATTTQEKCVPGKFEVHYDFAVMVVVSLALSAGFNLYQRHQYNELLVQHTALQWEAQDLEINQAMNLHKLEACNNPNPQ